MSIATTIFHAHTTSIAAVERALEQVFTAQDRPRVTRLEGAFSAVLARATDIDLAANYRYLICRPHPNAPWTPIIELGVRTVGLEERLSRALDGAAVFTTFVYGDGVSGYRLARAGAEVDRYASDPTYLLDLASIPRASANGEVSLAHPNPERERGRPERFADLLPEGTSPADFARVVLAPGWWEAHDATTSEGATDQSAETPGAATMVGTANVAATTEPDESATDTVEGARSVAAVVDGADEDANLDEDGDGADDDEGEDEEVVDEVDRMRCIALALELWGPDDYPFAQELEDIPNKLVGPAIFLGFA